ncbi:MAG: prenyltransferase/squalene oxidase repeat-containing protein [Gemmataceae bacterium]
MKRIMLVAVVTAFSMSSASAQTMPEKQASMNYVRGLLADDGGYRATQDKKEPSNLRATSAALRALHYLGAKDQVAPATRKFVENCFDKSSGGFANRPDGEPDVFTTAVGIMAAVIVDMPKDQFEQATVRYLTEHVQGFDDIRIAVAGLERIQQKSPRSAAWLKDIEKLRHADGTSGMGNGVARDTGGVIVAFLRLGGKLPHPENVLKALRQGQRPDGGFGKGDEKGSDLETSYRVMRAFYMLKQQPADPDALRQFVARCRNADGGYGLTPGQPSNIGPTYFAAIILHWLDQK